MKRIGFKEAYDGICGYNNKVRYDKIYREWRLLSAEGEVLGYLSYQTGWKIREVVGIMEQDFQYEYYY